ncbi:MAG: hypothetical protein AAF456_07475 [Planctomycetota bacterium]
MKSIAIVILMISLIAPAVCFAMKSIAQSNRNSVIGQQKSADVETEAMIQEKEKNLASWRKIFTGSLILAGSGIPTSLAMFIGHWYRNRRGDAGNS